MQAAEIPRGAFTCIVILAGWSIQQKCRSGRREMCDSDTATGLVQKLLQTDPRDRLFKPVKVKGFIVTDHIVLSQDNLSLFVDEE